MVWASRPPGVWAVSPSLISWSSACARVAPVARSVLNRCLRYCAIEAPTFAARGARIFARAAIWSVAAFWAASCCARRAMIVSMDAGGNGAGVAGKGVGVVSGASHSSPEEESSLLVTILLTLLFWRRPHGGRQLFDRETVLKGETLISDVG